MGHNGKERNTESTTDLLTSVFVALSLLDSEPDQSRFKQTLAALRQVQTTVSLTAEHRRFVSDALSAMETYLFFFHEADNLVDPASGKADYYRGEREQWRKTLVSLKQSYLKLPGRPGAAKHRADQADGDTAIAGSEGQDP